MKGLDPHLYTKQYYLSDCSGFEEFRASRGRRLGERFKKIIEMLDKPEGRLLDIGCGRGELAFWAARSAAQVVGIDYSSAGIQLAKDALKKQPKRIQERVTFLLQNALEMNFVRESFDTICLIDVLEHLYPLEQEIVVKKAYSILKHGGRLVAHTEPNRIYVDYTYPYWSYPMSMMAKCLWKHLTGKEISGLPSPSMLRTSSHRVMHINEPNYCGLHRLFRRAGFVVRIITKVQYLRGIGGWKDRIYNFLVSLHPLSEYFPANILFSNDFILIAHKTRKK